MTREFGKAPGDPGTLASQERPGRPGEIPEGNNPEDLLFHPVLGCIVFECSGQRYAAFMYSIYIYIHIYIDIYIRPGRIEL